jgi:serine/threonine protein kinase
MSPQQTIAHYRIIAKLGEGGMGEVWRATDTKLNREVAIKIIPEVFAQDADRMARFKREAQVLASLNHPNIAAIYGVEERALVMELVEGDTLRGPLPLADSLRMAVQIACALEYAHEHGVVHRDLKPANIKVTGEGATSGSQVKLLDFGLAKAIADPGTALDAALEDPSVSPTLTMATRAGVILGTAAYMSPEQAQGKATDRRSDIFSFGAVLYEMLTGQRVFAGESAADTRTAVLKLEPDWNRLPLETPGAIRSLLRRCLTKDRNRRLQAIGDARIVLEEVLSGAAADEGAGTAPSRSRPGNASRFGVIASAVAAAATVCAAGLAFVHFRETPRPAPEVMRFQIPPPDKTAFSSGLNPSVLRDSEIDEVDALPRDCPIAKARGIQNLDLFTAGGRYAP